MANPAIRRAMNVEKPLGAEHHDVAGRARDGGESRVDLVGGVGVENIDGDAQARGGALQIPHERRGEFGSRLDQRKVTRCLRNQLAQQPQSLGCELGVQRGDTGDVAARPAQAVDQTERDRVGAGGEHDRNARRRRLGDDRRRCTARRRDHADLPADQIGRHRRQILIPARGPAILDGDVLALDETGGGKPLLERSQPLDVFLPGARVQQADHRHPVLLRARRKGRRRHAAKKGYELAPSHGDFRILWGYWLGNASTSAGLSFEPRQSRKTLNFRGYLPS